MGTFKDSDTPIFKDLTGAIRALAMDAVQKLILVTLVCPWGWQK